MNWIPAATPPEIAKNKFWQCSDEVLVVIEARAEANEFDSAKVWQHVTTGVYDHRLKVWTNGSDKLLTPDPTDEVVYWQPMPKPPIKCTADHSPAEPT